MKKSKKKVASTMDERAQLISGESSARGYWVAMLGIFVTIMVASKTHSVELVQSLLIIFLWFYVPSISSQRIT
ncbi:MAG: hypothetical protein ACLS5G_05685 [Streptococcus sp.]